MADCIFCKIVAGDAPASVELESDNTIAFKSIDPLAETHILVVPKKHIETFMDFGDDDKGVLEEMAETAQAIIKKRNLDDGYRLVFNGGRYQAIEHVHWHLLGGEMKDESLSGT